MRTHLAPLRSRRVIASVLILAAALVLALGFAQRGAANTAGSTVTQLTWDVVGLKGNNVAIGPNSYPVGARLCNTSGSTINGVSATLNWLSSNSYLNLTSPDTLSLGNLATGSCVDAYYTVEVTRADAAFDTFRRYQISFSGNGGAFTDATPTNRQLYVEHLIAQARNSITGVYSTCSPTCVAPPASVASGSTFTLTVKSSTASPYEQIEAFLSMSGGAFRVVSASSTYSGTSFGATGTSISMYKDACIWVRDYTDPNYNSCSGSGKAGNTVTTVYQLKAGSVGSVSLTPMINDYSGSSFHYNADFVGYTPVVITVTPPNAPDLTIAKTHTGNFTQNGTGTYTVTVSNSGLASTNGTQVTVVETPPAGMTVTGMSGTGWSCDVPTRTCLRTTPSALAAGASYPAITVAVSIASNAASPLSNGVSVSGGGEATDQQGNNTATDSTIVIPLAPDLRIAKSHTGDFTQGQSGTYTVTVSNSGLNSTDSSQVTVVEAPPTGMTVTGMAGTGWTCDVPTMTCERLVPSALAAGASYPAITVDVDIASDAASPLSNGVSVSGGGEDPAQQGNNTAEDSTVIIPVVPDLTVTKTHTGHFHRGQIGAMYSIIVVNSGDAPTSGVVTLTETLPEGLTLNDDNGFQGGTWNCDPVTLTCTNNDVVAAGGQFPQIDVYVDVAVDAAPSLSNLVEVSGGGETDPSNNSDLDPTIIDAPDLVVTKSHTGSFKQGQVGATYSIVVRNEGTGPTVGTVTVTETLPTGLTATNISGGGWTCDLDTLTCTRVDPLEAGSSYQTITVTVDVATDAAASVTNTADVSGGADSDDTNNSDDDPTTIIPVWPLVVTVTGQGQVNSSPSGILHCVEFVAGASTSRIGASCTKKYNNNTVVRLTATPASGYRFIGWSGACSGASLTCSVTMSQARNVLAMFEPIPQHRLTVIVRGPGSVGSNPSGIRCGTNCQQDYYTGTNVNLNLKPATGYYVVSVDGCRNVTSSSCSVSMTRNRTVTVRFAIALKLGLELPRRLVFHETYDRASMYAHVVWKGDSIEGADVRLRFNCGGGDVTTRSRTTNSSGNTSFVEGRSMANELRMLTCKVTATASYGGLSVIKRGEVHFIHPMWLKVATHKAGNVRIAAFGRPGTRFQVIVRGSVVARGTLGDDGWKTLRVPGARRGDYISITATDHEWHSHAVLV